MAKRLLVRATIHLPGLSPGSVAFVDPELPFIATLITKKYLVPVSEN